MTRPDQYPASMSREHASRTLGMIPVIYARFVPQRITCVNRSITCNHGGESKQSKRSREAVVKIAQDGKNCFSEGVGHTKPQRFTEWKSDKLAGPRQGEGYILLL